MHQFLDTLYGNDYTVKVIQSPIQHPADRNNSLQILELCIALFMEETKLTVRKTDRRTIMTKGMIKDALLELLQNTPYEKITVTALCKQSEITRATFYLHYKDVFDLMEQIENELLKELEDMLNHHQAQDLLSRPSLIFAELYPLVQDNADIVSILIGENGDLNFVNRLKHIVREKCLKDWMALKPLRNSNAFEAYYAFIVSGCIGMVQYWLSSGMKESAEELAYMTENIILNGIRVLKKEAK